MSPRPRAENTTPSESVALLPQHDVQSADGTVIRAYWSPKRPAALRDTTAGGAEKIASTVILVADLAEAVPEVWRPQLEYLGGDGTRFVAWEYRGTRRVNASPGRPRYDVATHLEDLCAVLRAAEIDEPFTIIGSGVGVRIALEAALTMPERVRALVLLGGAAGWRYEWLCRASWFAAQIARQTIGGKALPEPERMPEAEMRAASEEHAEAQRGAGALKPIVPAHRAEALSSVSRSRKMLFKTITYGVERVMQLAEMSLLEPSSSDDVHAPLEMLEAVAASLRELGTSAVLDQAGVIQQPTLVLCGADDPRMPSALVHQLGRRLQRSWITIVPRSSSRLGHELPDLVNLEMERFFAELPQIERAVAEADTSDSGVGNG